MARTCKCSYNLFGETVTIAEEMEQRSQAGRILISEHVYSRLREGNRTQFSDSLAFDEAVDTDDEGTHARKAYFVTLPSRRRSSMKQLEEMATAKLDYFQGRTFPASALSSTQSSLEASKDASRQEGSIVTRAIRLRRGSFTKSTSSSSSEMALGSMSAPVRRRRLSAGSRLMSDKSRLDGERSPTGRTSPESSFRRRESSFRRHTRDIE